MQNMKVEGDILHEDYQRDMHLSLTGASLTGKITGGTAGSWNATCKEKGFEAYIIGRPGSGYNTVHGVNRRWIPGSVWNVTGESTLTALTIKDGAVIAAPEGCTLTMTVNGAARQIKPGTYKGKITIKVSKIL